MSDRKTTRRQLRAAMQEAADEWNFQATMTDQQRAVLEARMGEAGAAAYLQQRLLGHLPTILTLAGFDLSWTLASFGKEPATSMA